MRSVGKLRPFRSWYGHCSLCPFNTSYWYLLGTWLWLSVRHCGQVPRSKDAVFCHLGTWPPACVSSWYSMRCGAENIHTAALEASRGETISTWSEGKDSYGFTEGGFHFSRKLKVDQAFLRSWRHSRLKELNGKDRWAGSLITGLGIGILLSVALMQHMWQTWLFCRAFSRPGSGALSTRMVMSISNKSVYRENSPCPKTFGKHWILYCTLSKTQYLLT